jgi:hypothetical protein
MAHHIRNLNDDTGKDTQERHLVVAYLKYAVEDVAQFNETSAVLLEQAIAYLEQPASGAAGWVRQ